jgi:hypothetical protein
MKSRAMIFRRLVLSTLFCALALPCFSLDREAFSFTSYDLKLQLDPGQHRLGVRGKVTLRNDSASPQKVAALQISSTLDWRAITAAGAPVPFLTQTYTSDIDHTGALSEAIVTLPQAVAPKATVDLDIAYEGVILLDATRLTRIGTPDDAAKSSDWDQISPSFIALRGAGNVAWYPIATESANLSEGDSLFEILGRWKAREAGSRIHIAIDLLDTDSRPQVLFDSDRCAVTLYEEMGMPGKRLADCKPQTVQISSPTILIADYQVLEAPGVEVRYFKGHEVAAAAYADAAKTVSPLIADWFGPHHENAEVADLPDANAAPFESGSLLLSPLVNEDPALAGLALAHELTHAAFQSERPWIEEGLAHFAQALYLEQQKNRQAALDYIGLHSSAFRAEEKEPRSPQEANETSQSLVDTTREAFYRSKAMCVWWMLRDMIGNAALKQALAAYRPEQDSDPTYMPRLIEAQTQRDLEWFFNDWVYHDRGLPDFKVESAFASKAATDSFIVTVTVDNLGWAGAEVPVVVRFNGGEIRKRLEVRGKSKGVLRVETPVVPDEIVLNDGSVPESNLNNNTFKVSNAQQ